MFQKWRSFSKGIYLDGTGNHRIKAEGIPGGF